MFCFVFLLVLLLFPFMFCWLFLIVCSARRMSRKRKGATIQKNIGHIQHICRASGCVHVSPYAYDFFFVFAVAIVFRQRRRLRCIEVIRAYRMKREKDWFLGSDYAALNIHMCLHASQISHTTHQRAAATTATAKHLAHFMFWNRRVRLTHESETTIIINVKNCEQPQKRQKPERNTIYIKKPSIV